jgi:hypothetical protein
MLVQGSKLAKLSEIFHPLWQTFPNAFPQRNEANFLKFSSIMELPLMFLFLGQVGDVYPWIFIHYASPPKTPPHSSVAKKHNKIFLKKFL